MYLRTTNIIISLLLVITSQLTLAVETTVAKSDKKEGQGSSHLAKEEKNSKMEEEVQKASFENTQGKSHSNPDGGGVDKPYPADGQSAQSQGTSDFDGNNGCGNDEDFSDDNNGKCAGKQKKVVQAQNAPTKLNTIQPIKHAEIVTTIATSHIKTVTSPVQQTNLPATLANTGSFWLNLAWIFQMIGLFLLGYTITTAALRAKDVRKSQ